MFSADVACRETELVGDFPHFPHGWQTVTDALYRVIHHRQPSLLP